MMIYLNFQRVLQKSERTQKTVQRNFNATPYKA